MHQSGHSREHSMQTVQFSSTRAITPRVRAGRSGRTCGYWAVADRRDIVLNVTPSPLSSPAPLSAGILEPHLHEADEQDGQQRHGHEPEPDHILELVLAQPRV